MIIENAARLGRRLNYGDSARNPATSGDIDWRTKLLIMQGFGLRYAGHANFACSHRNSASASLKKVEPSLDNCSRRYDIRIKRGEASWRITIQFQQVIPILRIFDIPKADEFYLGFLGFGVDWDHRFDDNAPLYRQISRNGLVLHLSEHHGDGSPGAQVRVMMQGSIARSTRRDTATCARAWRRPNGVRSNPAS